MYIEDKKVTDEILTTRIDREMGYGLKAMCLTYGKNKSTVNRIAIARLMEDVRARKPLRLEDLLDNAS